MLCVASSSAAPKGEATIQSAYFTSSLFVDALRADVQELGQTFTAEYAARAHNENTAQSSNLEPFRLFKSIWLRSGWQWLHLKVLEPRARETFVDVVLRVFLGECNFFPNSTSSYADWYRRARKQRRLSNCPCCWYIWPLYLL